MRRSTQDKFDLENVRAQLTDDLQQAKTKAHTDQENNNRIQMQLSGLTHRLEVTKTHLERTGQQLEKLQVREEQLQLFT